MTQRQFDLLRALGAAGSFNSSKLAGNDQGPGESAKLAEAIAVLPRLIALLKGGRRVAFSVRYEE